MQFFRSAEISLPALAATLQNYPIGTSVLPSLQYNLSGQRAE
ncbi:hypothetical protein STRCR_1728 [Streptococcus criceti HS-6]|uniref:Uncharacterized protein n=1 Tax=Streptococcus criceti HS-6 TaxID=873449 RepID=G5JQ46_STRCG|nr:hypothetical protein STRCR_1728 [Streptococcus criceti HS-6]